MNMSLQMLNIKPDFEEILASAWLLQNYGDFYVA